MLKAFIAFLLRLVPAPNLERPRHDPSEEIEMHKLKVRMMMLGRQF